MLTRENHFVTKHNFIIFRLFIDRDATRWFVVARPSACKTRLERLDVLLRKHEQRTESPIGSINF